MRLVILSSTAILFAGAASASGISDNAKARELGQIIGTADICGYALDAAKAAEYVSSFLEKANESARSSYQAGSGAHKIRLGDMSEVERKVVCAVQAKLAAKYGLTP